MPITPLCKAFTSLSNEEAYFVCNLLIDAGINAAVREAFHFGAEPEVWIERSDMDRARPVFDAYLRRGNDWRMSTWRSQQVRRLETSRRAAEWNAAEQRAAAERRASARTDGGRTHETIEVICEDCGKRSRFPAALRGCAEDCPHCGAIVDVGEPVDFHDLPDRR